jgi:mannosyltransferase
MTGVDASGRGQPRAAGGRGQPPDTGAQGHPAAAGAHATGRHRALGARTGWTILADWFVAVAPAAGGFITGVFRAGMPPLWRDEAATKAIAERPVGQILATMAHDDAVHFAYYLVVHVVIEVIGSSNGALRFPSVLAMAVACAFTALIAQRLSGAAGRLVSGCTGLTAGLVFALLPATIRYAQEARSYAIVTMMATVATYLLVLAIGDGGRRWWAGYGAAIFLTGLFNIFGLLLLVAHGLTLLASTRRRPGRGLLGTPLRWLAAGVIATALTLPVVILAYGQRNALSWISSSVPVQRDVIALTHLWSGSSALAWPVFGLAAVGVVASLIGGGRDLTPGTVALPWLLAPPAILLAISTAHPVYDQRYVEFCLPALAICVAAGISWLWRLAAAWLGQSSPDGVGRGRSVLAWLAPLPAVAVAVTLAVALQSADAVVRQPGYRPDNLEHESQIIAANARPGDIVFYIPVNDRIVSMPFPGPWRTLRDIALARSPVSTNTLYGTDVTPAELLRRFTHVTRVWVVSSSEVDYLHSPQATPLDQEEARLIAAMQETQRWRDGDTELTLYAAR